MQLIEVTNAATAQDFITANVVINKHLPNYIRPLDKDVQEVFDKKKNKAFRFGECIRWVLKDDKLQIIGRIAAFVNKKYKTKGDDGPVGGCGFFDCINDQQAANILLNKAKEWLAEKGMTAMDGPINFGERERWWGMLVEGFDPPLYHMNFNPPYYKNLFETYGFQTFFNQYCYGLKVYDPVQEKFNVRHDALAKDPNYSARHINKNDLNKAAEDFVTVYNKAWAGHGSAKEMRKDVMLKTFETMKPILDEKIIWFAYYKKEPIAMWVSLPDVNQWFKYLNGNFNLFSKLKFLWYKSTKKCTKFTGLAFGIVPEFQAKGVDAFLIMEGAKIIRNQLSYVDYEMQWIGDFNPKMINIAESLGTHCSRKLITYRYNFDQGKEFKRHPLLS